MAGSGDKYKTSRNGKRKRFPIFSLVLVACYLVVSVLFFLYGFGEGTKSDPDEPPGEGTPAETASPPVVMPDITAEPPADEPVPLPPAVTVKGIYVGGWFAGDKARMDNYIDLCASTEINTLVIDVKEDHGYITFLTDNEALSGVARDLIGDIEGLVGELKSQGIYRIARIVCFKDPGWAAQNPQYAIQDKAGNQWTDRSGESWLDPYKRENWEYIAQVCLEAAKLGFEEIQLDYVRFPADGNLSEIDFGPAGEQQTKTEVIAEFVSFIRETMLQVGVRTSTDVFGIIALSDTDAAFIGQDLRLLLPNVDALSPMIYPSHFSNKQQNGVGQFINGILFEAPDTEPYEVLYNTLRHFIPFMEEDNPNQAILRPYLQDFTAAYLGEDYFIEYGADEVRAQIQAVYDAGYEEWILWNSQSVYSEGAFRNP